MQAEKNHQTLQLALISTLLIKIIMAFIIPMTGDEVYFVSWANHPDYGYYDHPPMVGWFLTLLITVSDHAVWLRLPSILITTFIGWGIYQLLKNDKPQHALLCAVLYLTAPVNLFGVLITTDTPLILFSFLSAWCFYLAQRNDQIGWYLLSGLCLGLAFYSKFFAAILGFAYFFYLLIFVRRGIKPYLGLLALFIATLPFIGLNILWNYNNCWDNYLFNLQNRTRSSELSLSSVGTYLVMLVYMATPPVFYHWFKNRRQASQDISQSGHSVFLWILLITLSFFALLSIKATIGLHWLLSFYPFLFITLALLLTRQQLISTLKFMIPFSALHIIALAVVFLMSPGLFKNNEGLYPDLVFAMETDQILEQLDQYGDGYTLATNGYIMSAQLAYIARKDVIVIGEGSFHGRQDDIFTDYSKLDGDNIMIFSQRDNLDQYADYFESYEIKPLIVSDAKFNVALGKNFIYPKYRDGVLTVIRKKYYSIPDFLPEGVCYFNDRYFAENE